MNRIFPSIILLVAVVTVRAGDYDETVAGTSYMLRSAEITAAIHLKSGHIKGIWDNETGQQYIADSYDTYFLENRGGSKAAEQASIAPLLQNADFESGVNDGVPASWLKVKHA